MKKILFIGNVASNDSRSIGGANTYTFEILDELKKQDDIDLTFLRVRTRWYKGGQLIDYLLFLCKAPRKITQHDVISIHATWDFHVTIGPLLVLFSKFKKKKVVYHFFGGNFHNLFKKFPKVLRWWLNKTILKSDYKLMETKRMISYFKDSKNKNFIWFPNTRKPVNTVITKNPFSKRFVFISRVTPSKGVDYFLETAKSLNKDYIMDIYGPLDTKAYDEDEFKNNNTPYKGVLNPSEVIDVLSSYDVLVLPTFYKGEGYPGIFIEAMSLGKPIICTKWNALDEIVIDDFNGKLIPIKSSKDLQSAIESFNSENYSRYSQNALQQFDHFNINNAIKHLLQLYLP
jgi:glycosyltransferase involved in cell wall biosynthesis